MLAIKYTPTAKCSKCVDWKIGNNYFQINLFCIYWGRSTAFISHSSLIYLRGTYENSTRKHFEPTKVPTRKKLDPRDTHDKKFGTHEKKLWTHKILTTKNYGLAKSWWHNGTRPTRPTMARDPQKFAYSVNSNQNVTIFRNQSCQ